MSAERTSCPYCWHYDCAGHTPAVMAAATAMRESSTVQLDMPTCTGLAELVSAAGLLVDRLPGESRKADTAGPSREWMNARDTEPRDCDHVRDRDGNEWHRRDGGWHADADGFPWHYWPAFVDRHGPLTEVPPAQSGEATA